MSGLAQAAVEHALEVGAAYRQNMALRHGLEQPRAIRVTETPRQPVAQAIPLPDPAMVGRSVLGMSPAGAALAAAALASLVSGAGGWLLAGRGSTAKEETKPQAAVVIEAEPAGRDDLLGYLQERGAHLPPRSP
jgi:hypothetical protein